MKKNGFNYIELRLVCNKWNKCERYKKQCQCCKYAKGMSRDFRDYFKEK